MNIEYTLFLFYINYIIYYLQDVHLCYIIFCIYKIRITKKHNKLILLKKLNNDCNKKKNIDEYHLLFITLRLYKNI